MREQQTIYNNGNKYKVILNVQKIGDAFKSVFFIQLQDGENVKTLTDKSGNVITFNFNYKATEYIRGL